MATHDWRWLNRLMMLLRAVHWSNLSIDQRRLYSKAVLLATLRYCLSRTINNRCDVNTSVLDFTSKVTKRPGSLMISVIWLSSLSVGTCFLRKCELIVAKWLFILAFKHSVVNPLKVLTLSWFIKTHTKTAFIVFVKCYIIKKKHKMMYVTIQFFYTIGTASCKLIQLSQWN